MGAKPLKTVGDFDRDEIHELAMDAIEHDPARFQTRAEIDMEVVNAWVKAVRKDGVPIKAWPPVQVTQLPDGRLVLNDGFHRWELHRKLGRKSIRAVIVPGEDDEDVLLRGIKANLDNLKFRAVTEADRQHAAEMMIRIEKFRDWGDKLIARRCGTTHQTVHKIRCRLVKEGFPFPERIRVFRKDGTWTGRTTPYRTSLTTGVPALYLKSQEGRRKPRYSTCIDGKYISLGSDSVRAQEKLGSLLAERDSANISLANTSSFSNWLMRRGISNWILPSRSSINGGIIGLSGAFLFLVPDSELEGMFRAAGKILVFLKSVEVSANRVVMVGYPTILIKRFISVLANDPFPIEFLTPEQVVAEFGPRPDGPEPGPEPPSP